MPQIQQIIAIDGPAGSGKSTIAKELAKILKFQYLDSGATYRACTWLALEYSIAPDNYQALIDKLRQMPLHMTTDISSGPFRFFCGDREITEELRSKTVNDNVSDYAKIPELRKVMVALQKTLAGNSSTVAEGRDMGSVVFPNAAFKFYLDASADVRASRRAKENDEADASGAKRNIEQRDKIDSSRSTAPLTLAVDAIYVDTSNMNISEVVKTLLRHIQKSKVD